jgi:hypothetical protein
VKLIFAVTLIVGLSSVSFAQSRGDSDGRGPTHRYDQNRDDANQVQTQDRDGGTARQASTVNPEATGDDGSGRRLNRQGVSSDHSKYEWRVTQYDDHQTVVGWWVTPDKVTFNTIQNAFPNLIVIVISEGLRYQIVNPVTNAVQIVLVERIVRLNKSERE